MTIRCEKCCWHAYEDIDGVWVEECCQCEEVRILDTEG